MVRNLIFGASACKVNLPIDFCKLDKKMFSISLQIISFLISRDFDVKYCSGIFEYMLSHHAFAIPVIGLLRT